MTMTNDIAIAYNSRAYLHSGETKYYRIAMVTVRVGKKQVFALLTNYGPYKSAKGDLTMHKPVHGGTSAIEYTSSMPTLIRRFESACLLRERRGYGAVFSCDSEEYIPDASLLQLQEVMRGRIGMIAGHYNEILEQLRHDDPEASAEKGDEMDPSARKLHEEFAAFIEREKVSFEVKHGRSTRSSRPTGTAAIREGLRATKLPPAGMSSLPTAPVIDRGPEWGSW